jgi:3-hydroxyisobutyrate dehydrogenase
MEGNPCFKGMTIMSRTIGFVGVGRMGANMARCLKSHGFPVTAVYDAYREGADKLATEIAAKACGTLADVTAAAEVVFTVVTDDAAQLGIFAETCDSLLIGAQGRTFVNCATVSPATHAEVEKRARKAGACSLEACMASSIDQALAGTLYLMCGGERAVFDSVREILLPLSDDGKLLRYIGTTGQAAEVKSGSPKVSDSPPRWGWT